MMILKIEQGEKNKILRAKSSRVEVFDDELKDFINSMHETLASTDNGIGLAAPQVGRNIQLFVVSPEFSSQTGGHLAFLNPKIGRLSRQKEILEEGCLSLPGRYDKLGRPEKLTIRARDKGGKKFKVRASGLLARLFHHEVDHLKGVLYIDHL